MLTLICGIPNAGKTTYASQFDSVIHLDDFPSKGGQVNNCNDFAHSIESNVCVEGVYASPQHRRSLIESCKHQTPKVCVWIDTPLDECVRRESEYRKRPLCVVKVLHATFIPPTLDEGWDEIEVIRGE